MPLPSPDSRRVSLTGELRPLGSWVVDASQRETPQPIVEQLPVPNPEAQEDAVDPVLGWWLQGRAWGMERGLGLLLFTTPLHGAPPSLLILPPVAPEQRLSLTVTRD